MRAPLPQYESDASLGETRSQRIASILARGNRGKEKREKRKEKREEALVRTPKRSIERCCVAEAP